MTKHRANISIDAETLQAAKAQGINISKAAEEGIRRELKASLEAQWKEDNKAAIEAYNARIDREGLPFTASWLKQN
ncbi:MAG: type II toxin-antitoxin system CcdA family antitoxin [Pseudomonadota bacterium]